MSVSLKTSKILWAKSGNKCAFPGCKQNLVMHDVMTDDPSVVGEEAHIVARNEDGPRGNQPLTRDKRDLYQNLILLCSIHHKIIDDQPDSYPVEKLLEFKLSHELWVTQNLDIDEKKQNIEIIYASYIEEIEKYLNIDEWRMWTSHIMGTEYALPYKMTFNLQKLNEYIISRVWHRLYPELERAIVNIKNVNNDLLRVFYKYADDDFRRSEFLENLSEEDKQYYPVRTRRFYKIKEYDEDLYDELLEKYEYHTSLIDDLFLELVRAVNYMYDCVRKFIFPTYRIKEGVLIVETGMTMQLSSIIHRVEYTQFDLSDLYPGLERFMTVRKNRDVHYGEGFSEHYFFKMR